MKSLVRMAAFVSVGCKVQARTALIATCLLLAGCRADNKPAPNPTALQQPAANTLPDSKDTSPKDAVTSYFDSLATAPADTTTLKGKREFLLNQFLIDYTPSMPEYKRLMDLNYDGHKDYVIGYYGQSGTGLKNRIDVYLYHPALNCYHWNEQLSRLMNPTFYIKKKKITGFYIANGSGEGAQLEWIKGKWVVTKEFTVNNNFNKSVWEINYPLKNKKQKLVRPYQMAPPGDILETQGY